MLKAGGARAYHLRGRYGLKPADVVALLEVQEGKCLICGRSIEVIRGGKGHQVHVDHDHVTGKVRGILCFNCNSGLGHFKDNPELLLAAFNYLSSGE